MQHNRRLFVLDGQMVAMNDAARWTFGVWLRRRYIDARRRELQATRVVEGCDVPEEELAKEWVAQVQAQLKKTPRTRRGCVRFRMTDLRCCFQGNLRTVPTRRSTRF